MEIEHVRLEREQRHADNGAGTRARRTQNDSREREARETEREHRDRHARRAGAVERIDLYGQQIQNVGKRQPHGADLRILGCETVENTPRDDEVRLGVVVAQRQAFTCVKGRRNCADDEGRARQGFQKSIGHVASRISVR